MNIAAEVDLGQARPPAGLLAQATDTRAMREAISTALGVHIRSVAIDRVLFSASRPVLLHYRYRIEGARGEYPLIGELLGADARGHFDRQKRRLVKTSPPALWALLSEPPLWMADGIVLRRPGFDAKLPGLRLLHDNAFAIDFMARVFGLPVSGARVDVSLKTHRLGKRATLGLHFVTGRGATRLAFARLRPVTYEAGQTAYRTQQRVARAASRASILRIPAPLHFDQELGATIIAALPGNSPCFPGPSATADATLAGKALAEWRTLVAAEGAEWTCIDEIGGLKSWLEIVRAYQPAREKRFAEAFEALCGDLYCLPRRQPVSCHRDFHEGQLLMGRSTCGLIDFDTYCRADPALDIGNFVAHLRLAGLQHRCAMEAAESAFLLPAEPKDDPAFAKRVAVWTRAAALRLAAIHGFTSTGEKFAPALVKEAMP